VYHNLGIVNGILNVEAIRIAQEKFGHRTLSGDEVRWGFEHLHLDPARVEALGAKGLFHSIHVTWDNHEGNGYLNGGLVAAQGRPKGGRRHQNLTFKEEEKVLAPLQAAAQTGKMITAGSVKTRYETHVGHALPDSTVYWLQARHQWRLGTRTNRCA